MFTKASPLPELRQKLQRYQQLRALSVELNDLLIRSIAPGVIKECAKKLGLYRNQTIIIDSEEEEWALLDYAIHYRSRGQGAVRNYLEFSPPPAGSDLRLLAEAFANSRLALFRLQQIVPRAGAYAQDILTEEQFFLFDLGIGNTAIEGLVLESRLVTPDEITMTTGASVIVPETALRAVMQAVQQFSLKRLGGKKPPFQLNPKQQDELAADIIAICLDYASRR